MVKRLLKNITASLALTFYSACGATPMQTWETYMPASQRTEISPQQITEETSELEDHMLSDWRMAFDKDSLRFCSDYGEFLTFCAPWNIRRNQDFLRQYCGGNQPYRVMITDRVEYRWQAPSDIHDTGEGWNYRVWMPAVFVFCDELDYDYSVCPDGQSELTGLCLTDSRVSVIRTP
ncbi:hypothetical protein HQ545_02095 [Candidatus Woesearchaeota archaeon]|nr:hypothetical protein [Candidatus Woesearchaeota archaeon]